MTLIPPWEQWTQSFPVPPELCQQIIDSKYFQSQTSSKLARPWSYSELCCTQPQDHRTDSPIQKYSTEPPSVADPSMIQKLILHLLQ